MTNSTTKYISIFLFLSLIFVSSYTTPAQAQQLSEIEQKLSDYLDAVFEEFMSGMH